MIVPTGDYALSLALSLSPQNYWARDDPAFVVLQIFMLFIASICHSIAFSVNSFGGFLLVLLQFVVINYIGVGVVVATICVAICTKLTVHHNHR